MYVGLELIIVIENQAEPLPPDDQGANGEKMCSFEFSVPWPGQRAEPELVVPGGLFPPGASSISRMDPAPSSRMRSSSTALPSGSTSANELGGASRYGSIAGAKKR